jgi:hypothetical protein
VPGEAPFRRIGDRLLATFSAARPTRLSIELLIASDTDSASLWLIEQGTEKLSRETVTAADAILGQLQSEFGTNNVSVVWRSEGHAAVTSDHQLLADALRAEELGR